MPTKSKKSAKSESKGAGKKGSGKRKLIAPKGDKRYIRRDNEGRITESDDQSKSLSKDVRKHAKTEVKPGYGDQGDQPQKKSKGTKKTATKKSGIRKKGAAKKG